MYSHIYPTIMTQTSNPHLKILGKASMDNYIVDIIENHKNKLVLESLDLLDIGGGKGWGKILYEKNYINYSCLDLNTSRVEKDIEYIKGDITEQDLKINRQFDIIFTKDTFEHILNPWDATQNILNLLRDGGLLIFIAPFSWRYHPSPYDSYRYSHTGAQYLFERLGQMKKIEAGYITCGNIGGFTINKKDWTIDGRPFPRTLETIYIGQKDESIKQFNLSVLDSDFDWKHEK